VLIGLLLETQSGDTIADQRRGAPARDAGVLRPTGLIAQCDHSKVSGVVWPQ